MIESFFVRRSANCALGLGLGCYDKAVQAAIVNRLGCLQKSADTGSEMSHSPWERSHMPLSSRC